MKIKDFLNKLTIGKKRTKDSKQVNKPKDLQKIINKGDNATINQSQNINHNYYLNHINKEEKETKKNDESEIKNIKNSKKEVSSSNHEEVLSRKIHDLIPSEFKKIKRYFRKYKIKKTNNCYEIDLEENVKIKICNSNNEYKTVEFSGTNYVAVEYEKDAVIELLKNHKCFFISKNISIQSNELLAKIKTKLFNACRIYTERWEVHSQIDKEIERNISEACLVIIEPSDDISLIKELGIFFKKLKSYKKIIFLINEKNVKHSKICKNSCCIIKKIKNYFDNRSHVSFIEYNGKNIDKRIEEIVQSAKKIVKL